MATAPDSPHPLTPIEWAGYAFLAVVVAVGIVASRIDESWFRSVYVPEDGALEYFTAFALLATGIICLARLRLQPRDGRRSFVAVNLFVAALMIFGAGEEVSWGQRIIGLETGDFFGENNLQNETNLHNLEFRGVNLNKLIFGKMLTAFLVLYYLVLPTLHMRVAAVRRLWDGHHLPVPKLRHGLAMLATGLVILLVESSKKGELNEVALGVFFFLTILFPRNRDAIVPTR